MTMALSTNPARNPTTPVTVPVPQQGEAVVLDVRGEVDLLTAPRLLEILLATLERGPSVVVIDLLAVSYFGASGLACLVEAQLRFGDRTRLRVVATGPVARQLHLLGVDRRIAVHPTRDKALTAHQTSLTLTAIIATAGPVVAAEIHHREGGLGSALISDD